MSGLLAVGQTAGMGGLLPFPLQSRNARFGATSRRQSSDTIRLVQPTSDLTGAFEVLPGVGSSTYCRAGVDDAIGLKQLQTGTG
jgi:hypothetical protein